RPSLHGLRIPTPIFAVLVAVGLAAAAISSAVATNDATVYVWPPLGSSVQNAYPWSTDPGCPANWSHSYAASVFDGGSVAGLYFTYSDLYNGSSDTSSVRWMH